MENDKLKKLLASLSIATLLGGSGVMLTSCSEAGSG